MEWHHSDGWQIEGPEGFVDMAAFERDKTTLAGLARGIGRIWVTSLLPTRQAEPFSIPVILMVREPGSPGVRMSSRVQENVPRITASLTVNKRL